jgi:peptidoglycan/xylan/chitin deacetylase (PgdA/CDA1 family)
VSRAGTAAGSLLAATAVAAVAHGGPALAAIGPLRRHFLPAVAGIGDPRHVALTFDDGPHPEATPGLLRLLHSAGVRATFFLLGGMLEKHPDIGEAIVAGGHEIGVHGYQHRLLITHSPRSNSADLRQAITTITALTGIQPRWWRPPYGVASTAALVTARQLGLTPVLWTCWGRDWTRSATPDTVTRAVLRRMAGGGTILLHDSDQSAAPGSWQSMLAALPTILTICRTRGLTVGPLGEHGLAKYPPSYIE